MTYFLRWYHILLSDGTYNYYKFKLVVVRMKAYVLISTWLALIDSKCCFQRSSYRHLDEIWYYYHYHMINIVTACAYSRMNLHNYLRPVGVRYMCGHGSDNLLVSVQFLLDFIYHSVWNTVDIRPHPRSMLRTRP